MTALDLARTWSDDAALAMTRAADSRGALMGLGRDADLVDDAVRALGDEGMWINPFDAVVDLAEHGNRGLLDGWTHANEATALFGRAAEQLPIGPGAEQLARARELAGGARETLGTWIANGGRGESFASVESSVRRQLEDARTMANLVLRNA